MTSVLLIYPFFRRGLDRSRFRFPPLGPAYIAAGLRDAGHDVQLLDCTFLSRSEGVRRALAADFDVCGIYCMSTMLEDCLAFAALLCGRCRLLVAGGPLPTCQPASFLEHFDVVVRGEGEETIVEVLEAFSHGGDMTSIPGVVCAAEARRAKSVAGPLSALPRAFAEDLDRLSFPARDLLPNSDYIGDGRRRYGYSITTVMSSRGCPFRCEFCSNVVFGSSYRERSAENVIDEVEEALGFGYDRISFADDVFTLNRHRTGAICDEIEGRRLRLGWECLARVDTFDMPIARRMKAAGCFRVFFGIESGSDEVLRLMCKGTTTAQARRAVTVAHVAGLQVGAFFILCYPGETDETVLASLRLATSLPLDYVGLSMPYPLPGTALFERVGGQVNRAWRQRESLFLDQVPVFAGNFSPTKMRCAILKGRSQFELRRHFGDRSRMLRLFEKSTDRIFRAMH